MRKKIFTLTLAVFATAILITGCGGSSTSSQSSQSASSEEPTDDADKQNENIVFAKVTKVEDGEITYEILERKEDAQKPEGSAEPDGQAPEKPEGSAEPDSQAPKKPEGSAEPDSQAPEKPDESARPDGETGSENAMMGFEATGETKTITVDDSIPIYFVERNGETSKAALTDITEEMLIQLQYSDEDELIRIDIPDLEKQHQQTDSSESASESDSGN